MKIDSEIQKISDFQHLELVAQQIVEGFISGMHKSPFHGFSAEFSEHKIHNLGESTKYIDWKLFAKTDKFYTKRFEEETNLRCHIIIDNSSSMHYPKLQAEDPFYKNKIGFSILATAVLMTLLKKQRDAIGLSIYSNKYDYYAPEKGSEKHYKMLFNKLDNLLSPSKNGINTDTATFLHQIAEKIHRRSMIILFTDLFQSQEDDNRLFKALQHLKHNKHKVVLFHIIDRKTETNFDFDTVPRKFIDVETGEQINLFAENIKENYRISVQSYFDKIFNTCAQYKIKHIPVSVDENFEKIITTYLVEKQKFK